MIDRSPIQEVDFFISYTAADISWAEWIAWQLESEGYRACIQAWDFQPGGNFIADMDRATRRGARTIAVLSPAYLESTHAALEWQAAMVGDPRSEEHRLLPVRVQDCEPVGLLALVHRLDLVGTDEQVARTRLLEGIRTGRAKPQARPPFPELGSRVRPSFPPTAAPSTRAPLVAPGETDSVQDPWAAFAIGEDIWLVEASGERLLFRAFGGHNRHGHPRVFGAPVADVAITETGSAIGALAGGSFHMAHMTARGRLREWSAGFKVSGGTRILAVRDAPGDNVVAILVESETTLAVTPRRLVREQRRTLAGEPSRSAAILHESVILIGRDGQVLLGTGALDVRDAWIDIDCATSSGGQLLAGARHHGSSTVLHVDRHDKHGRETRMTTLVGEASRVGVVRTPGGDSVPSHVLVQVDEQLRSWSWHDLLPGAAGSA